MLKCFKIIIIIWTRLNIYIYSYNSKPIVHQWHAQAGVFFTFPPVIYCIWFEFSLGPLSHIIYLLLSLWALKQRLVGSGTYSHMTDFFFLPLLHKTQ